MPKGTSLGIVLITLSILACGCFMTARPGSDMPPELRLGVLPDESRDGISQRYEGLVQYLAEELDVPCRLVYADSYDQLVELFHDRRVHLGYFGGVTFIQVLDQDDAVPLVIRNVDATFASYYIIREDSGMDTFAELEGKSFSFGSKLSTSGHYMPHIFIQHEGIIPEEFFSEISYSGAHDATALAVQNGDVDAGVVSWIIFEEIIEDGRLDDSALQVVRESRPYVNFAWAIQPHIGEGARKKICRAFLELLPDNERHAKILDAVGADYFVPAIVQEYTSGEEYKAVRELLVTADLQEGQSP